MEHLLVADDDEEFTELLSRYLEQQGFTVTTVANGKAALEAVAATPPATFDAVILDVMMPVLDGLDTLRQLRSSGASDLPVIMLTARGDDIDRIVGLELGADDYLPKPANPRELVARVRAILRRVPVPGSAQTESQVSAEASKLLTVGDLELNVGRREASLSGSPLDLTSSEWELMLLLCENAGEVVSKEDLALAVTGRPLGPYDRSLDMHVSNLRRKFSSQLGDAGSQRIKTVRNRGYQYAV